VISGTTDVHATRIKCKSVNNSLSTTHYIDVTNGAFNSAVTIGSGSTTGSARFDIRAENEDVTPTQAGAYLDSNSLAGYFAISDTAPTITLGSVAYGNNVALRIGETCVVNMTVTNNGSLDALYQYKCTEATDLTVTNDTSYSTAKI
jgi:hypothetical protein